MKKLVICLFVTAIIATVIFFALLGTIFYKEYLFDINCKQYLERATNAATIETAREELEKAISYAEAHHLTTGNSSLFWNEPQNDIGFWYRNLKASLDELVQLPSDATLLEKSNSLMRLKDALTTEGENGRHVICPANIAVFPNHRDWFCRSFVAGLIVLVLFICWYKADSHYYKYYY